MKLSPQDKLVIYGTQFDAKTPVPQLEKRLKLRAHTIHYSLNRLRAADVIRPTVFLDSFKLGIKEFVVYFSIASGNEKARMALIKYLEKSPRLVWFAQLGGNYQYAITILARRSGEVVEFLEGLSEKFGDIIHEKSLASIISFTLFKKDYLVSKAKERAKIVKHEATDFVKIDDDDKKIISAVFQFRTHQEMAAAIGIPRTTIEYRLKKLVEDQVIRAYVYNISATKIGMHPYKILLAGRGVSKKFRDKVTEFCSTNSNIVNLIQCIGSWDFEITVEVAQAEEMVGISQALYEVLGSEISKAEILPVFRQMQPASYLSR